MEKETYSFKIFSFLVGAASGVNAYFIILGVLFLCGLGLPIPEDIILVSAGYLAGIEQISLIGANIVCFIGVLIGDVILFSVGRKFGYSVLSWPVFKRVFSQKRINKAFERARKRAKIICFSARFMPGLRACIYLSCGIVGVPFRVFILQDSLAALLSVPFFVWVGFKFHDKIGYMFDLLSNAQHYIIIVAVLVFGFIIFKILKGKSKNKTNVEQDHQQIDHLQDHNSLNQGSQD